MIRAFLYGFLLIATNTLAEEPAPQPLDPKYFAEHGMVIMANGSTLYASKLPGYDKPDDVQLVYEISPGDNALVYLTRDADLVTIKPEPFNLQRLMRDESFSIKANVYVGRYDRDGMLTYPNMSITFDKQVYLRELTDLPAATRRHKYDSVEINNGASLLIHQIQPRPSFDHLLIIHNKVNCLTEFSTQEFVPKQGQLLSRLSFCGPMKPLHFEKDDFR